MLAEYESNAVTKGFMSRLWRNGLSEFAKQAHASIGYAERRHLYSFQ